MTDSPMRKFDLDDGTSVTAELLSHTSSCRSTHSHSDGAPAAARCSACRWTEVSIYRTDEDRPAYFVETVGETVVPGERRLVQLERTTSAHWVVETLVTRRRDGEMFLTRAARQALAEAAAVDKSLDDAFVNRAVA